MGDGHEHHESVTSNPKALLALKIVKLMGAVGYVKKTGRNTQQNYTYITEADLADKFRAALIANNLALIPSMLMRRDHPITSKQGNTGTFTQVDMKYRLIDGDTGYEEEFCMGGDGMDYGDKALYKAITGAKKYAMKELAVISTGDDPEVDEQKSPDTHAFYNADNPPPDRTVQSQGGDGSRKDQQEAPRADVPSHPEPPVEMVKEPEHDLEQEAAFREHGEAIGAAGTLKACYARYKDAEKDKRLSFAKKKLLHEQYESRMTAEGWTWTART